MRAFENAGMTGIAEDAGYTARTQGLDDLGIEFHNDVGDSEGF